MNKPKRDAIVEQIDQIIIRHRKIERFIETVKALPDLITDFVTGLLAALVDRRCTARIGSCLG